MLNKLINNVHDHTSNCRYFIIGISLGNLLLLSSSLNYDQCNFHISTGTGLSTVSSLPASGFRNMMADFLLIQNVEMNERRRTMIPRTNIPWSWPGLPLRNIRALIVFHMDSVQVGKLSGVAWWCQDSAWSMMGLRAGVRWTVVL